MSLESLVNEGIKTAMKSKEEAELRTLRAIKSAILLAKTSENSTGELTSEDELKLLQKLVKQRMDSLEIYLKQQRQDLATKEQQELDILRKFMPAQLSGEQLQEEVAKIIHDIGAKGPSDMGKVMGLATKKLSGQADGKAIAALVKQLLQTS